MNNIKFFEENGYMIVDNVFTENEINKFIEETNLYLNNPNKLYLKVGKGGSIIDFIKFKEFDETVKIINNKTINNKLKEIFKGDNYRYCCHNDIGVNRLAGWHKDKLNDEYAVYETIDIWSEYLGETHQVVKVLIYLQDHSNNNDGLKVVPKSNLIREIDYSSYVQLHPKKGDIIIFDQRITHRGMENQIEQQRILISYGFGINNIFTDNFEKGTIQRQNDQNNIK